ncbi:hypothetical protein ElyMa_005257400 [Elysia marginata]|uniref:Uncharacterized protein n=1 Tax=Elysia marginata TaxID=1093978 RepID=A0AAV4JX95_9GAST|nr:hypothetical protein ElyMa_005257400 [Elysia marginata]
MTSSGLRIQKSCADDATCLADWWLSSSTRPVCHREQLSRPGARLPDHVTCSVCCHAARDGNIHCSDDVFPPDSTLVQYPDVARPTFSSLPATTRPGAGSNQGDQLTQQTGVKFGGSDKYPEPMVCANCDIIDQGRKSSCGASTVCYGDKPLCMTSFFDDGQLHLIEVKRCAAVSECWDLWYNKTRLRADCMGDEDHDPYSWDGTKSGECHYCCHTPQGEKQDWCNKAMWPTKPKNLVDMIDYQRLVIDPRKTTVKTTTEAPKTTQVDREQTTNAATTEDSTTARRFTQTRSTKQVVDSYTTQDVETDQVTDTQSTQKVATDAPSTEQATTDQLTDAQTEGKDTSQKVTDAKTTEQVTTEHDTDERTTQQATTEKFTNAQTTEQTATESVTADKTAASTTIEQVTDEQTTEQLSTKPKTTVADPASAPATNLVSAPATDLVSAPATDLASTPATDLASTPATDLASSVSTCNRSSISTCNKSSVNTCNRSSVNTCNRSSVSTCNRCRVTNQNNYTNGAGCGDNERIDNSITAPANRASAEMRGVRGNKWSEVIVSVRED